MQRSPAPALVVATPVGVGDVVEAGAPVIVLESMKMETVLHAPFPARVKELLVTTGSQVETGTPLVRLEQVGDEDPAAEVTSAGPPIELPQAVRGPAARRASVPGPQRPHALWCSASTCLLPPRTTHCRGTSRSGRRCGRRGSRSSRTSSSCSAPSPTSPSSVATSPPTRSATRSCACTALASTSTPTSRASTSSAAACRGTSASGWPEVLRHYGVLDLERSPQLEEAVFRIFLAQQRSAPEVAIATALLGCWIAEPAPTGDLAAHRAGCWNGSAARRSCGSP